MGNIEKGLAMGGGRAQTVVERGGGGTIPCCPSVKE